MTLKIKRLQSIVHPLPLSTAFKTKIDNLHLKKLRQAIIKDDTSMHYMGV
ncbi:hypothetical protein NUITMVR1_10520 [Raoultella ornithinolytica]|nr:hypothetical protein NUITMVR1_10520 [Raoultella ornithinolytica]